MDKMATVVEGIEEGVGRMVLEMEEKMDELEARVEGKEEVVDTADELKDLHQQVLELEANHHEHEV